MVKRLTNQPVTKIKHQTEEFYDSNLDIIFLNPEKGGINLSKSEKKFHKETTVITPGIDVKNRIGNVGKKKAKTTVFNDEETRNI